MTHHSINRRITNLQSCLRVLPSLDRVRVVASLDQYLDHLFLRFVSLNDITRINTSQSIAATEIFTKNQKPCNSKHIRTTRIKPSTFIQPVLHQNRVRIFLSDKSKKKPQQMNIHEKRLNQIYYVEHKLNHLGFTGVIRLGFLF